MRLATKLFLLFFLALLPLAGVAGTCVGVSCSCENDNNCDNGMCFGQSCASNCGGQLCFIDGTSYSGISSCSLQSHIGGSCDCSGCTNCTSDADYSAHSTGYQKKVTRSCNCNTCSSSTSYRCAAGYYGSSATGTSGCSPCPTGGTSNAGATVVTNCYASTTSGTDATGTWEYDQTCYYSETE